MDTDGKGTADKVLPAIKQSKPAKNKARMCKAHWPPPPSLLPPLAERWLGWLFQAKIVLKLTHEEQPESPCRTLHEVPSPLVEENRLPGAELGYFWWATVQPATIGYLWCSTTSIQGERPGARGCSEDAARTQDATFRRRGDSAQDAALVANPESADFMLAGVAQQHWSWQSGLLWLSNNRGV